MSNALSSNGASLARCLSEIALPTLTLVLTESIARCEEELASLAADGIVSVSIGISTPAYELTMCRIRLLHGGIKILVIEVGCMKNRRIAELLRELCVELVVVESGEMVGGVFPRARVLLIPSDPSPGARGHLPFGKGKGEEGRECSADDDMVRLR